MTRLALALLAIAYFLSGRLLRARSPIGRSADDPRIPPAQATSDPRDLRARKKQTWIGSVRG